MPHHKVARNVWLWAPPKTFDIFYDIPNQSDNVMKFLCEMAYSTSTQYYTFPDYSAFLQPQLYHNPDLLTHNLCKLDVNYATTVVAE